MMEKKYRFKVKGIGILRIPQTGGRIATVKNGQEVDLVETDDVKHYVEKGWLTKIGEEAVSSKQLKETQERDQKPEPAPEEAGKAKPVSPKQTKKATHKKPKPERKVEVDADNPLAELIQEEVKKTK